MTGEISRKHFVIILENSLQEFSCITCCILPSDLTNRFSDKKKKPLTRYLLTHQQLLFCFVSVYYEFYRGIWFSVAQEAHSFNGTFFVPTKFLCLPASKIHRETELYVLQESAIRLLLLVNVHLFYKTVKKFFLLQVGELII